MQIAGHQTALPLIRQYLAGFDRPGGVEAPADRNRLESRDLDDAVFPCAGGRDIASDFGHRNAIVGRGKHRTIAGDIQLVVEAVLFFRANREVACQCIKPAGMQGCEYFLQRRWIVLRRAEIHRAVHFVQTNLAIDLVERKARPRDKKLVAPVHRLQIFQANEAGHQVD